MKKSRNEKLKDNRLIKKKLDDCIPGVSDRSPKKLCGRCRKWKPVGGPDGQFSPRKDRPCGYRSYCKTCLRVDSSTYRESESYRAREIAYRNRPDVRERHRAYERIRSEKRRDEKAAYDRTPKGKLIKAKSKAIGELKRTGDKDRKKRLNELIGMYESELNRLSMKQIGDNI